jgi:hypothetical protein
VDFKKAGDEMAPGKSCTPPRLTANSFNPAPHPSSRQTLSILHLTPAHGKLFQSCTPPRLTANSFNPAPHPGSRQTLSILHLTSAHGKLFQSCTSPRLTANSFNPWDGQVSWPSLGATKMIKCMKTKNLRYKKKI